MSVERLPTGFLELDAQNLFAVENTRTRVVGCHGSGAVEFALSIATFCVRTGRDVLLDLQGYSRRMVSAMVMAAESRIDLNRILMMDVRPLDEEREVRLASAMPSVKSIMDQFSFADEDARGTFDLVVKHRVISDQAPTPENCDHLIAVDFIPFPNRVDRRPRLSDLFSKSASNTYDNILGIHRDDYHHPGIAEVLVLLSKFNPRASGLALELAYNDALSTFANLYRQDESCMHN